MAYINNKKFGELRTAASQGNEKAARILQLMRQNGNQDDISKLVDDYYLPQEVETSANNISAAPEPQVEVTRETLPQGSQEPQIEDLTEVLDRDLDGLISQNDVEDITFGDFLKNKKTDGLKNTRTADYFKMYNPEGRTNYMNKKNEEYQNKFNGRLKDIDRQYRDLDNSLNKYIDSVNLNAMDDAVELNFDNAGKAYNDMTDSHDMMLGLGRGHDEEDFNSVTEELNNLIAKYGKKNVVAALNTLKSDNDNYRNHRNGQIEGEISRYKSSLAKLIG
jgi:hypothetical protein